MKLAFCLFKYFPFGGLQRDFLRIAKACIMRGHAVHVFTTHYEGEPDPSMNLHIIKKRGIQNHRQMLAFAKDVKIALNRELFDVVIGFNKMPDLDIYYAADTCYQARIGKNKRFLYYALSRYRHYVALERAIFAKGHKTHIMLISPKEQQAFVKCYQTEGERFHLLPPGISKDRVASPNDHEQRCQLRSAFGLTEEQFLILLVGSRFSTKGLDRALRALAALPDPIQARSQLFVVGDDNPARFNRLAKHLGILKHVQFFGGRSDVKQFMLAADLLLHPPYVENTGTVLLEALASNLPVLTLDVCGYAHFVQEANAGRVLTSPFDQVKLNKTLEEMLLSPDRVYWQANAYQFARQADIYHLPEKAADFIEYIGQAR